MEITPIPCLTDNYAYVIYDNNSKTTAVVDPSESQPIISFLKKKNFKLNYILNTHHHFDHIGGNIELKKIYNSKIIGFEEDKHRIPGIDIELKDKEIWNKDGFSFQVFHIPGHTSGHICFYFKKIENNVNKLSILFSNYRLIYKKLIYAAIRRFF